MPDVDVVTAGHVDDRSAVGVMDETAGEGEVLERRATVGTDGEPGVGAEALAVGALGAIEDHAVGSDPRRPTDIRRSAGLDLDRYRRTLGHIAHARIRIGARLHDRRIPTRHRRHCRLNRRALRICRRAGVRDRGGLTHTRARATAGDDVHVG